MRQVLNIFAILALFISILAAGLCLINQALIGCLISLIIGTASLVYLYFQYVSFNDAGFRQDRNSAL